MNISIQVYILDRHTRKVNGEIKSELGKNVILRFATSPPLWTSQTRILSISKIWLASVSFHRAIMELITAD